MRVPGSIKEEEKKTEDHGGGHPAFKYEDLQTNYQRKIEERPKSWASWNRVKKVFEGGGSKELCQMLQMG